MGHIVRHAMSVTTDSGGDATAYFPAASGDKISGRIVSITYATGLDTGGDCTFTSESTGAAILTITNVGTAVASWYPHAVVNDITGGVEAQYTPIAIASDRIKLVVAQGGTTLSTTFYIVMET